MRAAHASAEARFAERKQKHIRAHFDGWLDRTVESVNVAYAEEVRAKWVREAALGRLYEHSVSKMKEKEGHEHWSSRTTRKTLREWREKAIAGLAAKKAFGFLIKVSKISREHVSPCVRSHGHLFSLARTIPL